MNGFCKTGMAAPGKKPHFFQKKSGGLPTAAMILIFLIRIYRWTISPMQIFLFGSMAGCRFTPTCSQYAIDAIRERGAITGSWLAAKRICRCHPFGGCGHDPVANAEGKFILGDSL
jgi:uncharacterized protein